MLKEADDLVEIALKKSENGARGFEPQVVAMEAATNTGQVSEVLSSGVFEYFIFIYFFYFRKKIPHLKQVYELTVGYSFKQGSPELRKAVLDLENALTEIISDDNHKLIFILIPRFLRKYIPLKYWPCEF